ncbi:MAG: hypothetical protein GC154_18565 [bacterium]|nr:hypothetical protein [bacterium]
MRITIYDIGVSKKYRLAASIHFNTRRLYIRAVLTHADYAEGKWREWI